jgi:hypothetical protein
VNDTSTRKAYEAALPLRTGRTPSPLLTKLAMALKTMSPEGPSGLRHSELESAIKNLGDKTIGVFSLRNLSRAKVLAWPELRRKQRKT